MKEKTKAYNNYFDRKQGMQGSEVYLLIISKGDKNQLTDVINPGL
jgi:hypothetical protein